MDENLRKLLEILNIADKADALYNAYLTQVKVTKDNTFLCDIEAREILPYDEYMLLLDAGSKFMYPCTFYLHYSTSTVNDQECYKYLNYIFTFLQSEYPVIYQIDDQAIEFIDNRIVIKAINEIQSQQINDIVSIIEKELNRVGIYKYVECQVDYDNQEMKDIQKEMETYQPAEIDLPELSKKKNEQLERPKYYYKDKLQELKIEDIAPSALDKNIKIKGFVFKTEIITTKSKKNIQSLWVTDYTNSIIVKRFENKNTTLEDMKTIGKGNVWVEVVGDLNYDNYAHEQVILARTVEIIKGPKEREDTSEVKRVELHTHSRMSAMDGIGTITQYVKQAAKWGHKAIAITDHGNVQAFPEAQSASLSAGIKMIYGCELNMIDPHFNIVFNCQPLSIEKATFVSFDLETTGLSVVHDSITEFGAVKIENGQVIDRLDHFIKPKKPISAKIQELTNITNDMVADAPTIEEYIDTILDFFGDAILVAHNAKFDVGFLNETLKRMGRSPLKNAVIDSLPLARVMLKPMKSYRLGNVCRYYHVTYDEEVAHRADYDAEVLGEVFNMMMHELMQKGIYQLEEVRDLPQTNAVNQAFAYHATAIALNKAGLKNLFKIVTEANTTYLTNEPRIPKEELEVYREGLLYGTSCYRSDVFEAAMNSSDEVLENFMKFYDYVEIQPLEDYHHLVARGKIADNDDIIDSIKRIIKTAKKLNKIIVATGDVHFLDKKDKLYRDVFIANPTIGINHSAHPLCDRKNPRAETPCQYLRSTDEMLQCYPYLSKEEAFEYVVTNTNKIADMVEEIKPIHSKLYPPSLEDADKNLKELCYETAHKLYGDPLPDIVEKRLDKELNNIIVHGFGVIYYIAHKLVKKSNDDGYLVGSRGSVGSSFVATMSNITEVNPLAPHYLCLHCGYNEFVPEGTIADGYDLPDKRCPVCGKPMKGEGHQIPFETFLGFNADKVPDIDLNFSGVYQPTAHAFTKEIFGDKHVFRAGTISTVAEKTAYGYAQGYAELLGIDNEIRSAELERIAHGCEGTKRTTGQHPGGIIVIPGDMDVYDFTPVQYPADDVTSVWKTTHFDFHAIHDNVLKFDILGHVDPTVTRNLQDLTGVNPRTIPTNDTQVMSLFTSSKAMGIDLSYIGCNTGALGLPEFGTPFVRGMLEQTKPKTFNDLVIISGLSHGTDVYLGNAEVLIKNGTCTLSEVIGCRDDIMVYLIEKGLPNKDAFDIMECVRKGKSPKVFPEKHYEELMKKYNVPQWYIDSCKKIKYMFPKAHAAAYVLSAIRVAWWKLYYPREYYAVYFSTRCDFYDIETMVAGKDAVLNKRAEIENLRKEHKSSNKDEGLWTMFEIALEMFDRGYHFNSISLEKSLASDFSLDEDDPLGLIPPFACVDGLGESVALTVVEARKEHHFLSKEDVIKRTKLSGTHIKTLAKMGVFDGLQEENQLSLF